MFLVLAAGPVFGQSAIKTGSIDSKVLGAEVKYNVYLPDGFGRDDRQYPVVYLLHGLYGSHADWVETGRMKLVMDELVGTGEAAKAVVIMPCAGDMDIHNVWNGYFNMPGWNYEDFFFTELMPTLEGLYRCGGSKGLRAIMGLSMGGGGSTVYCQRHPELFSSCYAMSAWLDQEEIREDPQHESSKYYWTCLSVRDHSALKFVENADGETLKKLDTVRWFFDSGDDDGLTELSFRLHRMLRAAGVNSELRVRNGAHNWEYWHLALRDAIPFASRNFSK